MNTRTLKQMLLVLGAVLIPMFGLVVVFDRNAGGAPVATCGPQNLQVTDTNVSVDPAGCEVQLAVWSYSDQAVEQCIPDTEACIWLPQNLETIVAGAGPLTLELPCGGWQADVFDTSIELPAVLTQEWLGAHVSEVWATFLAGDSGDRICEPDPGPPEVEPRVIERPAPAPADPAAPAAPVATAAVRFAG